MTESMESKDDFFQDLDNEHFKEPNDVKATPKLEETENIKLHIHEKTKRKTQPRKPKDEDIFSDNPTELIGKEKIILQNKVTQYKNMFKQELKSFKIRKNATIDELKASLLEMEALVNVNGINEFITDSILNIIRMTEGISSRTNYDISGCADMLKSNPQFLKLCQLLYIKYKIYSEIPPEFQLIMIVGTTSYFCMIKNKKVQA